MCGGGGGGRREGGGVHISHNLCLSIFLDGNISSKQCASYCASEHAYFAESFRQQQVASTGRERNVGTINTKSKHWTTVTIKKGKWISSPSHFSSLFTV